MTRFILNDTTIATDLPPGMVVLDFIRYHRQLMGTKIGCREGDCGACTVLVGTLKDGEVSYQSMTSCLLPLGNLQGKHVVTIEGINNENLNPVQQAMADEGATQCGFCTPGFVISLAGFCLEDKEPSVSNAIAAVDGNICRCTGYKSIERAAAHITRLLENRKEEPPLRFAVREKILPAWFERIKNRLQDLLNGEERTSGSETKKVMGGGTDLYVQQHEEMQEASLRFFFDHPALNGIEREGNRCIVGPSATVTDLRQSPIINESFPAFHRYAKLISSTPIRNMATIAGNFINASPIGDFTIFFLALDAQLELSGNDEKEKRRIALRKLYKGYKDLDKDPQEYISRIYFELPSKTTLFNFEKVSKRTHLDIATVNSAIWLDLEDGIIQKAGLSAGGVGPIPLFLEKTSAFLKGKSISEEIVEETIAIARSEISPISDVRGSKEYKSLLLGQLIKAHFITLFPKLEIQKLINAL
ncbi:MAG TPA: FAD binding domain-containing protein [Chitinophagaceae bacterium]|nr:FAD binding domain-containing protein [Chitinophagaceae bacterium]